MQSIELSSHYFSLPNYKLVYEHAATLTNRTGGEFIHRLSPSVKYLFSYPQDSTDFHERIIIVTKF